LHSFVRCLSIPALWSETGLEDILEKSMPTQPEMAAKVKTFNRLWIEIFMVVVTL
jgi:hypothetical protein